MDSSMPPVTVDGTRLCSQCLEQLRRDLAELPALYEEGELALGRVPHGLVERVSGTRGAGISLDEAVVDARTGMVGVLASWSALVVSEAGVLSPPARAVRELVEFLLAHMHWLAAHHAAGDFADEIAGVADAAREGARPSAAARVELGPCIHEGCDGIVYAVLRSADGHQRNDVRCGAGHTWAAGQWLLLAQRLGQLGQPGQAAAADEVLPAAGVSRAGAR